MKTFTAQISDFVKSSEKRMIAVARQAIQETIEIAQTPIAKGGNMRVDTGFLRASGQLSLTGIPAGPIRGDDQDYDYDENITVATLAGLQLGGAAYFGWTANYAKHRELHDGFLEIALGDWQKTVDDVVKRVKSNVG